MLLNAGLYWRRHHMRSPPPPGSIGPPPLLENSAPIFTCCLASPNKAIVLSVNHERLACRGSAKDVSGAVTREFFLKRVWRISIHVPGA